MNHAILSPTNTGVENGSLQNDRFLAISKYIHITVTYHQFVLPYVHCISKKSLLELFPPFFKGNPWNATPATPNPATNAVSTKGLQKFPFWGHGTLHLQPSELLLVRSAGNDAAIILGKGWRWDPPTTGEFVWGNLPFKGGPLMLGGPWKYPWCLVAMFFLVGKI